MKHKLFTLAALGTMLLAAACTEKMAVPDDPVTPGGTPFSVKKGIGAYCLPLPSEAADTKSSFVYGDVEKKKMIRSVQVFVYNDVDGGELVDDAYFIAERPLSRFDLIDIEGMLVDEGGNLDPRKTYRFYFLANLPEIAKENIPASEEEMEDWTCSLDNYDTFNTYGFPMCAQLTDGFAVEDFSGAEDIPFIRLVSQWKVTLKDTGSGVTFDNCSVAVRNAARTIQPFSSHPAPAQVFNDNILASGDHGNMSIAASGDVAYFYVLENMGGEAFPDAESLYDRDVKEVNKNNPNIHPTYIEITSKGTIDGTALILDNTVYRYALGNGNVTNADAQRHTEYNVSLNFTETAADNEGWVKDISDPYVNNPHIGFVHKMAVVNCIGSSDGSKPAVIPFDAETVSMIEQGGEISVEWENGNYPVYTAASNAGPNGTLKSLLQITIENEGIRLYNNHYYNANWQESSSVTTYYMYSNGMPPARRSDGKSVQYADLKNSSPSYGKTYYLVVSVKNGNPQNSVRLPVHIGPMQMIFCPVLRSGERNTSPSYSYSPTYAHILFNDNTNFSFDKSRLSSPSAYYAINPDLYPIITGTGTYYFDRSNNSKWYDYNFETETTVFQNSNNNSYCTYSFAGNTFYSIGFRIAGNVTDGSWNKYVMPRLNESHPYAVYYNIRIDSPESIYSTGGPDYEVEDVISNATVTRGSRISYSLTGNNLGFSNYETKKRTTKDEIPVQVDWVISYHN